MSDIEKATWEWTVNDVLGSVERSCRIAGFLDGALLSLHKIKGKPFITLFGQHINCVPNGLEEREDQAEGGQDDVRAIAFFVRTSDMPSWITIDSTGILVDSTTTVDAFGYHPRSGNTLTFQNNQYRVSNIDTSACLGHIKFECESMNE